MDTRRRGAFLMIVGANLIAASVAMGVYFVSIACMMLNGDCATGLMALILGLMTSAGGLLLGALIVIGALLFWWGRRMRARG